ncbi:S-layer family protein [Calothrix membranacea FACHB-236]|nr:S-layer family protein [Calothrix membranacea FACHB-236]
MRSYQNPFLLCKHCNFNVSIFAKLLAFLVGLTSVFPHTIALAQITPDETLGNERSVITPNVNIQGAAADQIDGGAIRGSNLFHSFGEFNIQEGQRVYFANPAGINHILSRVTGNNPSNILGTLGVNGSANLFFINPNGIIFGKNASLDVGKSFYATTANSIKFGELGEFGANNPQLPSSLLTINPSAFFFNPQTKPGEIISKSQATQTVNGTPTDGLQVPNGQTLLLLGGNVTVDGGILNAWGGRVEIGAVAGTGTVGLNANNSLNVPEGMPRADVVFKNGILDIPDQLQRADVIRSARFTQVKRAGVDVRLDNGGDINITAGNISILDGSQLRAGIATGLGTTESQAGELIVNATGEILMRGDDGRLANDVRRNATGKAGNIQVKARSLVVLDGAQLSASTFGVGDAGNVIIQADSVVFSGTRTDELGVSAAFSRIERPARGKGGNVQISTNILEVVNGAGLWSSTQGTGDSGNVVIMARDRVSLYGKSLRSGFPSSVYSNVLGAIGKGGNVEIFTNTLNISDGAQIIAATDGRGDAGNILINAAKSVNISGTAPLTGFSSALFTSTYTAGKGGDIIVNTPTFRLVDGAILDADTYGDNRGGNITVNAGTVDILNGAQMLASTEDNGRAGNITINASEGVNITGIDPTFPARLAKFRGRVGTLSPNSGIVVRSQASGDAGEITINAPRLRFEQGFLNAESATGDGGNIILNLQDLLLLRDRSFISATAGTAQQGGNGGNITINVPSGFIVAAPNENSDITANAFQGSGGKVNINAAGIFGIQPRSRQELEGLLQTTDPAKLNSNQLPTNDITAISQTNPLLNGEINLNTPDTDPSKGLEELPLNIVDVSGLINQNLCVAAQGSEFIMTGRGGLPPSPYDTISANPAWEDWSILPQIATQATTANSSPQQPTASPKIVEAQGLVKDVNGNLILTAQPVTVTPKGTWLHPQDCQMLRGNS